MVAAAPKPRATVLPSVGEKKRFSPFAPLGSPPKVAHEAAADPAEAESVGGADPRKMEDLAGIEATLLREKAEHEKAINAPRNRGNTEAQRVRGQMRAEMRELEHAGQRDSDRYLELQQREQQLLYDTSHDSNNKPSTGLCHECLSRGVTDETKAQSHSVCRDCDRPCHRGKTCAAQPWLKDQWVCHTCWYQKTGGDALPVEPKKKARGTPYGRHQAGSFDLARDRYINEHQ